MQRRTRLRRPQLAYRLPSARRLPAWERELIVRMYEEEIRVVEIAEAARVSTSTVYAYLREARSALAGWAAFVGDEES